MTMYETKTGHPPDVGRPAFRVGRDLGYDMI